MKAAATGIGEVVSALDLSCWFIVQDALLDIVSPQNGQEASHIPSRGGGELFTACFFILQKPK